MKSFLKKLQLFTLHLIDVVYIPFRRIMPLTLFRYGVCGTANMLFDWVLYYLVYHYVVDETTLQLTFIAFTPHIASMFITFPITFASGFLLSKYISFQQSSLKSTTQLVRYMLVVAGCIIINYICLKLFVEVCGFYPTPSKMLTTVFTVMFSYFSQKNYTFRS